MQSLPTRERGLKHYNQRVLANESKSLPTRERGLKLPLYAWHQTQALSLPTRERGLKHVLRRINKRVARRSPRGSVD